MRVLAARFASNAHVQAVFQTLATLDLQPLHDAYRGTGSQPYPPERLLAICLFEILNGITSPAAWCRDADTRDQCKLLGRGIAPSRSVWYDFRDRCGKFIDSVHQDGVKAAIEQQQIDPSDCALDGTFTAAAASRHKIFNLKQVNRRIAILKRAIRQLDDLNQVASRKPLQQVPRWIAATPRGRKRQLNQYRQAKQRMLENIEKNRSKRKRFQRDEDKMIICPTDIDAAIGKDKRKLVRPLFNTQNMTDCGSDVVVAYGVWPQTNDSGTLAPMIEKTQLVTENRLKTVHADSSYCSILEIKDCEAAGINLFAPVQDNTVAKRKSASGECQIPSQEFDFHESTREMTCPSGHPMKFVKEVQAPRADGRTLGTMIFEQSPSTCENCDLAGRCLGPTSKRRTVTRQCEQYVLDRQKEKMESDEGRRSQKLRAQVVERRFADGKMHRNQDVQNGRGLKRVKAEVGLLVVAQNALTIYNMKKHAKNGFT